MAKSSVLGLFPAATGPFHRFFIFYPARMRKGVKQSVLSVCLSEYLGYGRVRVFADLMCVNNTVESGHYLDRCADWGMKLDELVQELVHTSHSQNGVRWR